MTRNSAAFARTTSIPVSTLLLPALLVIGLAACGDSTGPAGQYSQEAVDYYVEVALGSEYGNSSPVVRKWRHDIVIGIEGEPSEADLAEFDRVVAELNELRRGPRIRRAAPAVEPNVRLHFAPASSFGDILPEYVPGNRGFFWYWYNHRNEIIAAVVLIDNTDAISQTFRNHLIREEITQALGLAKDSPRYPGSIFYDRSTPAPVEYTPLDREVIQIHDLPGILPGMTEAQVRKALGR